MEILPVEFMDFVGPKAQGVLSRSIPRGVTSEVELNSLPRAVTMRPQEGERGARETPPPAVNSSERRYAVCAKVPFGACFRALAPPFRELHVAPLGPSGVRSSSGPYRSGAVGPGSDPGFREVRESGLLLFCTQQGVVCGRSGGGCPEPGAGSRPEPEAVGPRLAESEGGSPEPGASSHPSMAESGRGGSGESGRIGGNL